MKELFRERELITITYYESLLNAEGIETFIKNENVSALEGVSIPDFFPALCILHDEDYEAAEKIIKADLARKGELSE